jgi:hypothetical protein
MKYLYQFLGISLFSLLLGGCFAIEQSENSFEHIAPGIWRGLFVFGEEENAEKVPINFEVMLDESGNTYSIEFLNGKERVKPDSIRFWGDTLYMYFNESQKYFRLIYEVDLVEGFLLDVNKKAYPVEFYAQHGKAYRFKDLRKPPSYDISGSWAMDILEYSGDLLAARIDFEVDQNNLKAVLKTEKDSSAINMEGTIQEDKILLSAFDGNELIFFEADLRDSVTMGRASIRFNEKKLDCSATKR